MLFQYLICVMVYFAIPNDFHARSLKAQVKAANA
jgi:hypothetical protein